jgi:uncharacterized protein (DUF924 family)
MDDGRSSAPGDVVAFWREAGFDAWFTKNAEFDRRFRDRFLAAHERAARGELDAWAATPIGALALVVLLDQFPRNAFRGEPRAFATDPAALAIANAALAAGFEAAVPPDVAPFFSLPLQHSENLADQDRAVALAERYGGRYVESAREHREIVRRFGRFPHRNPILGRPMRPDEQAFLAGGGFAG